MALLGATVVALLWANSPWPSSYESVWTTELSIRLASHGISLDLREWVNEGLMTFFFLVVGLEAKRELDLGALRDRRRIALPVLAALGGMSVPILIYLAFNAGGSGAGGWGAAMSTDTAFALGVLALVAPGATRLRVRLLTIVVVDDLVALLGDRDGVHRRGLARSAGPRARVLRCPGRPPLRAGHVARAGRRGHGRGGLGRAVRVGDRSRHRRSRGRARHERVSAARARSSSG